MIYSTYKVLLQLLILGEKGGKFSGFPAKTPLKNIFRYRITDLRINFQITIPKVDLVQFLAPGEQYWWSNPWAAAWKSRPINHKVDLQSRNAYPDPLTPINL